MCCQENRKQGLKQSKTRETSLHSGPVLVPARLVCYVSRCIWGQQHHELCLLGLTVNWLLLGAHGTSVSSVTRSPSPPAVSRKGSAGNALPSPAPCRNAQAKQDSDGRESRCCTKVTGNVSLPFSSTWAQAEGQAGLLEGTWGLPGSCPLVYVDFALHPPEPQTGDFTARSHHSRHPPPQYSRPSLGRLG